MWNDKNDLLKYCLKLEGRRIKDVASKSNLAQLRKQQDEVKNGQRKYVQKQLINDIIEQDCFNTPKNNSPDPDLELKNGDEWELKVSHTFVAGNGWITPEYRLVLKMLDYNDIAKNPNWKNSGLYKKLNQMVVVYYHKEDNTLEEDYKIICARLFESKTYDSRIVKDYAIMRNHVNNGIVISEKNHSFLANCPKHSGGFKKRNPASSPSHTLSTHPNISHAEKRGYCIKKDGNCEIFTDMLGIKMHRNGRYYGAEVSDIQHLP